jgi:hypothetical protein
MRRIAVSKSGLPDNSTSPAFFAAMPSLSFRLMVQ